MPANEVPNPDGLFREAFSVTSFGGTVSFAYGRKGFRSSVWDVTVTPAGDVYINERTLGREIKTSLHVSGNWQHGWVRDQKTGQLTQSGAAFKAATNSRIFDPRRRPAAAPGGAGITPGLGIVMTHDDVTVWPNDTIDRGAVRWSDSPAPGQAGLFQVLFQKHSGPTQTDLIGVNGVVGVLGMKTGDLVVVTAALFDLGDDELAVAANLRAEIRRTYTDEEISGLNLGPGEFIRAQFIRPAPTGHREIWDLALPVVSRF